MRRLALLAPLVLAACGPTTRSSPSHPELVHHAGLATTHLASCDDPGCGEAANPPLGGPHCGTWSTCRVFDAAVPRCNWLHNLEHGHAVLAFNCPEGCPDLVKALTALWKEQQDLGNGRVLVTPDPKLPSKVAALVWGWGWTGATVDAAAVRAVLAHQDEDAPERGEACSP